jgi:sugar phosphate isomerase/epimerase
MTLCSKIDEDPRLDGIVGLNLDVAHWGFLAGITPEMVRNTPSIRSRIYHAHFCDHSAGHFVDAIPGFFHTAIEFLPWYELLTEINSAARANRGFFSGYLTGEFESVRDSRIVTQGFSNSRLWCPFVQ